MLELAAASFVTLFVIFDSVGNVPIFLSITPGASAVQRRGIALRGTLIAGGVLVVFGVGGEALLRALGITLPAFRIAGGILLLLLAIEMVFARQSGLRTTTSGEAEEAAHSPDVAVFPLAVPLLAGPGALASMLLLMGEAGTAIAHQAVVLISLFGVLAATFAILVLGGQILARVGVTGVNVLTRIFGIVLSALAVQYIIDGVQQTLAA